MSKQFLWVSLFSGCGGSTLGAIASQFIPLWANEFDPAIAQLYKQNIKSPILVKDLVDVRSEYLDAIPTRRERDRNNQILTLQISPPCQEFSGANRNRNASSDRGTLIYHTFKVIVKLEPEYIIIENVPAYRNSEVYLNWVSMLGEYVEDSAVLDSADFGVPQNRKRFYSVLSRQEFPIFNMEKLRKHQESKVSWWDAIAYHIENLKETHLTKSQLPVAEEFIQSQGSEGVDSFPFVMERVGFYKTPKLRTRDRQIWTLRSHLALDGRGGSRPAITIVNRDKVLNADTRCLSQWQGFPDNFVWGSNFGINIKAIGNSVTPPVITAICNEIKSNFD